MAIEHTLSIIKPDAVGKRIIGPIIQRFEAHGLRIVAMRMTRLSEIQAQGFYHEHKQRDFFASLVKFMTSGPIVAQVLEGDDAIARNRKLMGVTDPTKAAKGTIRADFASNIEANIVHGSDSIESARREIAFFFPIVDIQDY